MSKQVLEGTPTTKLSETFDVDYFMGALRRSIDLLSSSCMSGTSFGAPITTFDERFMDSVHISQIIQNNQQLRGPFTPGV